MNNHFSLKEWTSGKHDFIKTTTIPQEIFAGRKSCNKN